MSPSTPTSCPSPGGRPAPARPGLDAVATVALPPGRRALLEALPALSTGAPAYRARKAVEVRELFGLEAIAARLEVLAVDARAELKALLRLRVPVAVVPPGADEAAIAPRAELAVRWPEELLLRPLPGFALVQVVAPRHVMHPNVSREDPSDPSGPGGAQALCLGAQVPRGMPLREVVLGSYAALAMQSITLDERDPAGVMSVAGARFWQERLDRIPLTREPFLAPGAAPESADGGRA